MSINYTWICLNFLYGILVSCWNILGSESVSKTSYPEGFHCFQNSFKKIPEKGHKLYKLPFLPSYNSLIINYSIYCAQSKRLTALSSKAKTIFKVFC